MTVGLFCDCLQRSETVSVLEHGKRIYFGECDNVPSNIRNKPIWHADTTERKGYRTKQTNIYIIVKTEFWQLTRY